MSASDADPLRLRIDSANPDRDSLRRAVRILRAGGLVAFPTETVYGLGANALDPEAVRRIFAAKGRPAFNPLIAHLPDADAARALSLSWPDAAARLAEAFWPGPLTLVVEKRPDIPDEVTAGLPTVALRVPAHPVAHALLRAAGVPLAAPSANRYTGISPTTADHVLRALGDRVDLVLDAGPTGVGIESTVLDVSGDRPVLLRPGTLSLAVLESVVGPVGTAAAVAGEEARPAPGMVRKHYAPRARLRLVPPRSDAAMARALEEAAARGERVGGMLLGPPPAGFAVGVAMPADADGYARRLYAALHEMDDAECDLILVEEVPDLPEWAGVRDRLRRAAED